MIFDSAAGGAGRGARGHGWLLVREPLLQLDPITEGLGKGRRLLHPKQHRATN